MDGWGLPRDAITYSAVISALSKGRQWSLGESQELAPRNVTSKALLCHVSFPAVMIRCIQ